MYFCVLDVISAFHILGTSRDYGQDWDIFMVKLIRRAIRREYKHEKLFIIFRPEVATSLIFTIKHEVAALLYNPS